MNTDDIRAALKPGISYNLTVSIPDHPQIRETYRTDSDAQGLLDELVPIVERLISEAVTDAARATTIAWQLRDWTELTPIIKDPGTLPIQKVLGAAQVVTDWLRAREGTDQAAELLAAQAGLQAQDEWAMLVVEPRGTGAVGSEYVVWDPATGKYVEGEES